MCIRDSSSIYRDYLSSDREKLYVDSASYAAFFKDSLNAASLLRYGTYLLHYLCSRSHIKIHYRKAAYEKLFTSVDSFLSTGSFSEEKVTEALHASVCSLLSPNKMCIRDRSKSALTASAMEDPARS